MCVEEILRSGRMCPNEGGFALARTRWCHADLVLALYPCINDERKRPNTQRIGTLRLLVITNRPQN